MAYLKGTEKQANDYNNFVTSKLGLKGVTNKYDEVIKIGKYYYVQKHYKYISNMKEVKTLPEQKLPDDFLL